MSNGKALCLLLVLGLTGSAQSPLRTELLIRAVDKTGAPVRLTRADVYFDVWGGTGVTHIPHDRTSVRLRLDRAGACGLEPVICANHATFSARIILEAEGLAPVSSDLFAWMQAGETVKIAFPQMTPLRIRPGSRQTITLTFRPKQSREIRLVDRSGAPVADALVSVRNFFAGSNHMGFPEGDVLLENGRTNANGRLAVPDGDIEYSFMIGKPHWSVVGKDADSFQNQVVTRMAGGTQTIVLRRHVRRPLMLAFRRDGRPADGVDVRACVVPCGGACCGPLGTTYRDGNLTVRDFYPEEYDRVFVPTRNDEYKSIWEVDPRTLSGHGQRLTVNLPR